MMKTAKFVAVLLSSVTFTVTSFVPFSVSSKTSCLHNNCKTGYAKGTLSRGSSLCAIKIPNLFGGNDDGKLKLPSSLEGLSPGGDISEGLGLPSSLDELLGGGDGDGATDPEVLVNLAKAVLASDLGARDGTLLADDFFWVGGNGYNAGKALDKADYLAACKFFDLRKTFPDLDYRAHDFRLDTNDPNTVRLTARTVGTMRGPLRLRKETLPPNGKRMVCPPEAITMTFDPETGKLKKMCSGFTMDRLVGNTKGLCGVMGAAVVAGASPSEWEIYPPVTVVTRFFGRPVRQVDSNNDIDSFLAPFPETVMISLAKGVIAADNGATDPDLLSSDFSFSGPIVGPVRKDEFVKAFGGFNIKGGLPDLEAEFTNFRVDPYDPYRVWVDAQGRGTRTGVLAGKEPTGKRYEGPPEAASFTFDDDGFCTRLTAGAVMDPTQGNTGGLGGVFGILYATGSPFPGIVCRPLPELLSRLQTKIISPITKVDVDSYDLTTKKQSLISAASAPPLTPTPPATPPTKTKPAAKFTLPKPPAVANKTPPKPKPPVEKATASAKAKAPPKSKSPFKKVVPTTKAKAPPKSKPPVKKVVPTATAKAPPKPKPPVKKAAAPAKAKATPQPKPPATKPPAKKSAFGSFFGGGGGGNAKKKQGKPQAKAVASKVKQDKAAAAADARAEKAKAAAELKTKQKKELAEAAVRAKKAKEEAASVKNKAKTTAPQRVPSLARWRKNRDGSVTGKITGSDDFADGKRVTTSEIKSGEIQSGNVVVTMSGSKYFLE